MVVEVVISELVKVVVLLGVVVVMVFLFCWVGLGLVLGYFVVGLVIGLFGLGWFFDLQVILYIVEFGVVMFLFVIGLEMWFLYLWSLCKEIFGLGMLQIVICVLVLISIVKLFGLLWQVVFIGVIGFVFIFIVVVMQLLVECGDIVLLLGQKIVLILLFEDLLIVLLLVLVVWMVLSVGSVDGEGLCWLLVVIGVGVIVGLVLVGCFLFNLLFCVLVELKVCEVMIVVVLLVVLGVVLLMQLFGLLMVMGVFLVGVLLSELIFCYQIEVDIELFRGILLGLFFFSVGMVLDLGVVVGNWQLIFGLVLVLMVVKVLCIYVVVCIMGSDYVQVLDCGVLMVQGGEFVFVLFFVVVLVGVINLEINVNFIVVVVLLMVLILLVVLFYKCIVLKLMVNLDGVDEVEGLFGSVLLIGFGCFGQVVSQLLLVCDVDVIIIDNDVEMIQSVVWFGFKIYYGDGMWLDVLYVFGVVIVCVIVVCVDKVEVVDCIVELVLYEFLQVKLMVCLFDCEYLLWLIYVGVDFQICEMFELVVLFGQVVLVELGVDEDDVVEIVEQICCCDVECFELEIVGGGLNVGVKMVFGNFGQGVLMLMLFIVLKWVSKMLNLQDVLEEE